MNNQKPLQSKLAISRSQLRKAIMILCIAIFIAGGMLSYLVYEGIVSSSRASFTESARQANATIVNRLNNYNDLLYAGRGMLQNSQNVTQAEWSGFFEQQDTFTRYTGISSILYIKQVSLDERDEFVAKITQVPEFSTFRVQPEGDREVYGLTTLSASSNNSQQCTATTCLQTKHVRKCMTNLCW